LLSLPMRGEWIEIFIVTTCLKPLVKSLPMRGEWIEIIHILVLSMQSLVSPHAGRVD